MIDLARMTFGAGSIAFIFIGAMHTYVHFRELAGAPLQTRFEKIGEIPLQGGMVRPWDLFQGTSLLMGFFSATLGAVLLSLLLRSDKSALPAPEISAVTCLMLVGIAVIGRLYLSRFQIIGGAVGILCFGLPLCLSLLSGP